jgi:hypothetical protein
MQPIATELERRSHESPQDSPKIACVSMAYASTRESIESHSAALRELVENLPGRPKLSFVGHSLGNIVVRHAIGHWQREQSEVLGRLDRVVMLGPPNQGSSLAKQLSRLKLFETITGSTGRHLGDAWEKIQSELATPPCPFAIVIGDISNSRIQNPFLDGPSDGIVTVEEAKLDGAAEIRTFPVLHSFLMSDQATVQAAVSFLLGGSLTP